MVYPFLSGSLAPGDLLERCLFSLLPPIARKSLQINGDLLDNPTVHALQS